MLMRTSVANAIFISPCGTCQGSRITRPLLPARDPFGDEHRHDDSSSISSLAAKRPNGRMGRNASKHQTAYRPHIPSLKYSFHMQG